MTADRLRVSDRERERVVGQLRDAMIAGRLSLAELDQRVADAYRSVTRAELIALLDDLPSRREPARARPLRLIPGLLPFSVSWRGPADPRHHGSAVLRFLGPIFTGFGYELTDRAADRLVYRRSSQSVLAVVFLGLPGLLLGRRKDTITVDMVIADGHTLAVVQGVAPLRLRRAFARLGSELEHERS